MTIIPNKDLINSGKCFTKGKHYEVETVRHLAGLMDKKIINDQGELHIIGGWWRYFEIIKN